MKARRCSHGSDNHPVVSWVIICVCALVILSPAAYCEEPHEQARPIPEYAKRAVEDLERQAQANFEKNSKALPKLDAASGDARGGVRQDGETGVKQDVQPDSRQESQPNLKQETKDPLDIMGDDVEPPLRQDELRGPGRWFFNTRIGQRFARFETGDIRKRPMMYWRRFADRRVPPIGTFLFFFFFNTVICLAFRKRVVVASQCVRKSFWKSLFVGGFFVILMGTAARLCFDSVLFTPCALFFLGVAEFLSLCGLAVSSRTIGSAIVTKLGYLQASQVYGESFEDTAGDAGARRKAKLMYLVPVFIGTALLTLIALIPGLGPLPRLGTRFVMWLAVLGLGALVRTQLGRKELT